jgi:hypothetical protein
LQETPADECRMTLLALAKLAIIGNIGFVFRRLSAGRI